MNKKYAIVLDSIFDVIISHKEYHYRFLDIKARYGLEVQKSEYDNTAHPDDPNQYSTIDRDYYEIVDEAKFCIFALTYPEYIVRTL
jgi:hypothetical protein